MISLIFLLLNILTFYCNLSIAMDQDNNQNITNAKANEEIQKRKLEARQKLDQRINDLKQAAQKRADDQRNIIKKNNDNLYISLINILDLGIKNELYKIIEKADKNYINYLLNNFTINQIETIRIKILNIFEKELLDILPIHIINCDEKSLTIKEICKEGEAIFSPNNDYIIFSGRPSLFSLKEKDYSSFGFTSIKDFTNNKFEFALKPQNEIIALNCNVNGLGMVVACKDGTISFYKIKSEFNEDLKYTYFELFKESLINHNYSLNNLEINHNNLILASYQHSGFNNIVRITNYKDFKENCQPQNIDFTFPNLNLILKFSPDGKYIVAATPLTSKELESKKIIFYEIEYDQNLTIKLTNVKEKTINEEINNFQISPDCKSLAIIVDVRGFSRIQLYDTNLNLKKILLTTDAIRISSHRKRTKYINFTKDSKYILEINTVSVDIDRYIDSLCIWDIFNNQNEPIHQIQLKDEVTTFTLNSTGKYILTQNKNGSRSLLDIPSSWIVRNFTLEQLFFLLKIFKNAHSLELINNPSYSDIFESFNTITKDQLKQYAILQIVASILGRDINNKQESQNIASIILDY